MPKPSSDRPKAKKSKAGKTTSRKIAEKPKTKKPKQAEPPPLTYELTEQFFEDFAGLSPRERKDIEKSLKILDEHKQFTPGMRAKPIPGIENIWYLRASSSSRITFSRPKKGKVFLRRCGDHSVIDKERR